MKNIKSAFTIGEILVAVAIVGLVAALSIPNLNKNINEDKYIALMKSTMSQLDTAIAKVVEEDGSLENAITLCIGSSGPLDPTKVRCIGDKFVKYLDVNKSCTYINSDECFSTEPLLEIDGTEVDNREESNWACDYSFILSNGASVCLRNFGVSPLDLRCDIDVDGPQKGPNMRAVDNFNFEFDDYGLRYFDPESVKNSENEFDQETYQKSRRDIDRGFNTSYDSVAWAFLNGNMDYLRCANQLKWYSKKTCD